jgi:WD40 repeat protein
MFAIASGSFDGTVEVWRRQGSSKNKVDHLATLTSKYEPNCVAVDMIKIGTVSSAMKVAVACISRDASHSVVKFYKLEANRGVPRDEVIKTSSVVSCMICNGTEVITGDASGSVRVWTAKMKLRGRGKKTNMPATKWVCRSVIQVHSRGAVRGLVLLDSNGRFAATIGADECLKVLDLKAVPAPPKPQNNGENVTVENGVIGNGSAEEDEKSNKRFLVSIETGGQARTISSGRGTQAHDLIALSVDNKIVLFRWNDPSNSTDNDTDVNCDSWLSEVQQINLESPATCLTFLPDGTLVSGHENGAIAYWRGNKVVAAVAPLPDTGMVASLAAAPTGGVFAGFDGGFIRLFQ